MAEKLSGRLVTTGDGHLYIQPTDKDGEVNNAIHLVGEDGEPTDELIPDLVEVRWDHKTNGFVRVKDGNSHNDTHHERFTQEISATVGDLYDSTGNLVQAGDPHHVVPLPNDPHYDESAPNKTTLKFDDDETAATITSHTEAWS